MKIENQYPNYFSGWLQTTVDNKPEHPCTVQSGLLFVLGEQIAPSLWSCSIRTALEPGQELIVDPAFGTPAVPPTPTLPADLLGYFGGPVMLNGQPMVLLDAGVDGASLRATLRGKIGPLFTVTLYTTWFPDEPGRVMCDAHIVCSNISDMSTHGDCPDIRITFGDGITFVPWSEDTSTVLKACRFGDGQSRIIPFGIAWPQHMPTMQHWQNFMAVVYGMVSAVGVHTAWPNLQPFQPTRSAAAQRNWCIDSFRSAVYSLHSWSWPNLGPVANSAVSGDQEEQVFTRHEALLPGGTMAASMIVHLAMHMAKRPCHHRMPDGSEVPLDLDNVYWQSRPYNSTVISHIQYTIPWIGPNDMSGGAWGADDEHWLISGLAMGFKVSGRRVLLQLLRDQCSVFLFQQTVPSMKPGWSTNAFRSARSIGWEGIVAVWLAHLVPGLGELVKDRWKKRFHECYVPQIGSREVWDSRLQLIDSIATEPSWMPWQQSIGAWGLWYAGKTFGEPQAVALAVQAAEVCVERNWVKASDDPLGPWRSVGNQPVAGWPQPLPKSFFNSRATFSTSWDIPAIFVLLSEQPGHAKAQQLLQQVTADLQGPDRSWLPTLWGG